MRLRLTCLLPLAVGLLPFALCVPNCTAAVTVLGVQYQPDIPYSEYDCIWKDSDYPNSCPPRALGCNVHLFLRNTGGAPITINDATVAGYSLETVLKLNTGVHDARSIYFYWDNPPADILNAGEPVWYKGDPKTIPANGVSQVVVRLRQPPTTPTVAVGAVTSGGNVTTNITVDVNAAQLVSVGFSQDRTKVYLHWRRPGGGNAAPATVWMDGANVTAQTTTVGDATMNFAASVIQLAAPLDYMSYHVFQGVYPDGKTATAGLRTFAHPFVHATWGTFPWAGDSTASAQAWIDEATGHGFNTGENQGLGGALGSYLNTSAGRAYADARGGYRTIVWNKSTSNDPLMGFTNDEPDAEEANMERTFCNTGLNLPCGKSPMGILVMREIAVGEDYRNTFPLTATTVNLDGTFRPENYYAWGQAFDVVQVDPYYQRRLQDVYWRDQERIPLYRKATYIYAVSRAMTTATEPNRSLIILYSCEWRCQNSGACDPEYLNQTWPFPTPESKRIEAYYAVAAGAKGLSYWWFNTGYPSNGLGDQSKATARALWKEMGIYGNELKVVWELLPISHPVDLPLSPGANVWARALAVGTDTTILIAVNDDYYNDVTGCHYNPVNNATVTATLPGWMQGPLAAFEVTAAGLQDVSTQASGNQLQVNLGTLKLTKMVVLTKDLGLKGRLQERYDQQVRANVCAFAPELCTNSPPGIAQHPANQGTGLGGSASFTVAATGTGPLSYRWQKCPSSCSSSSSFSNLTNGGHYSWVTTPTLVISNADTNDVGSYRCVVSNAFGGVASTAATLTITNANTPPVISQGPVNRDVVAGGSASFAISAQGAPPLSYQWQKTAPVGGAFGNVTDDGHYAGATTPTLTVSGTDTNDAGSYRCVVTNLYGSATSSSAALTLITVTTCLDVQNADFEGGFSLAGGGYLANGWTEWEAEPGVIIGYDETGIVRGGGHAQRLRVSGGPTGSAGGVYQRVPVAPGQAFSAGVWTYAGDNLTAAYLGVDPAGGTNPVSGVLWSSPNTNMAWVQKTVSGIATANFITVYLKVASSDNVKRNGFFDDVSSGGSNLPLRLRVQRSGNELKLSWPECPNARLEWADNLSAPISWTTATNQINTADGQKNVTLTPTGNAGYFRLVLE